MASLDLAARRVVVASILYYSFDETMMPDAEFDKLCVELCKGWKELSAIRKWQLGSVKELEASGFHIKATSLGAAAAVTWLEGHRGLPFLSLKATPKAPWREGGPTRSMPIRWLPAGAFNLQEIT